MQKPPLNAHADVSSESWSELSFPLVCAKLYSTENDWTVYIYSIRGVHYTDKKKTWGFYCLRSRQVCTSSRSGQCLRHQIERTWVRIPGVKLFLMCFRGFFVCLSVVVVVIVLCVGVDFCLFVFCFLFVRFLCVFVLFIIRGARLLS